MGSTRTLSHARSTAKPATSKRTAIVRRASPALSKVARAQLFSPQSPSLFNEPLRAGLDCRGMPSPVLCPLCHFASPDHPPRACVPEARLTGAADGLTLVRCSHEGIHLHRSCQHCGFLWIVDFFVEAP